MERRNREYDQLVSTLHRTNMEMEQRTTVMTRVSTIRLYVVSSVHVSSKEKLYLFNAFFLFANSLIDRIFTLKSLECQIQAMSRDCHCHVSSADSYLTALKKGTASFRPSVACIAGKW